jgi:hypothetical protein
MAVVLTKPATANYTYNHTNITSNQNYELEVTQAGTTVVKKFTIVNQDCFSYYSLLDGINYNTADASKATLVLDAPLKILYMLL